ncbi:MAG: exodeoxyribonuclease V subunit alpha [Candidatus Competibacteraceae bacterium]|jgi:exodeoxyribonuclease V alpha subunit|nr:exodeoxyribonuclease V subunit alpha [Candidatus Competibacteraceae bacterium]
MADVLDVLHQHNVIDALYMEFARLLAGLARDRSRELLLGCALVSRAVHDGDVCLDLNRQAGKMLLWPDTGRSAIFTPALDKWRETLNNSTVVGQPGEEKPLVLDAEDRLYLYRYWDYEKQLATDLKKRAARLWPIESEALHNSLEQLFPPQTTTTTDWQKVAAAVAVLRGFSVISGGPGTGKTTTLARILALLIEHAETPPRIRLAAPTGKAAARMQEAIRASKTTLVQRVSPTVLDAIPEDASTLHRLLGPKPDGVYFRHDRSNPLNLDVLVIDEASMVDLALMTKTVWALPTSARLILLGDRDQLSSVEAGAVLGELCVEAGRYSLDFAAYLSRLSGENIAGDAQAQHPLRDSITLLSHSYRFGAESGIGQLAQAVNRTDVKAIKRLIKTSPIDVQWHVQSKEQSLDELLRRMQVGYQAYLDSIRHHAPVTEIIAKFSEFQLLCPQRGGERGVENLNLRFETLLKTRLHRVDREWYAGRAVMITRNDYTLRLFNGDIGITLPDPEEPERLRVYFQSADGAIRHIALTRLPAYEPVFAMTIHKSQGSEFDQVLLVLPHEDSPVLTRELIYTGITRARVALEIRGDQKVLLTAVQKSVVRASGLGARLLED